MIRRASLLPGLFFLVSACTPEPACPSGTEACADGGRDAATDAGPPDAGEIDANIDHCASPDTLPVVRFCAAARRVQDCSEGAYTDCRSDQHCAEFVDVARTGHFASCFFEGSEPCDPSVTPTTTCDDAVISTCQDGGGPIGSTVTIDCRALLGYDDATCVAGEETPFLCEAPEAVACDPATTAPTCDGERLVSCRDALAFHDGPALVRSDCGAGERCLPSRRDGRGVCLGSDATEATGTPRALPYAERCIDETTVRVAWEGYVYGVACPLATRFVEEGEETVQTVCVVDGGGGYACVDPVEATACASGTASTCESIAGTDVARRCVAQGDGRRVLADQPCALLLELGSLSTGCADGACEHVGPCTASDVPVCLGDFRVSCDATLTWTAEACTTCTPGGCT